MASYHPDPAFNRLNQWRAKGAVTNINGNDIFFIDEGDKQLPVLLLIHGFPTSSWDWQAIWPQLRQSHRVVCMDMLGFGFSDKPNARNYTIHGQADIVEALVSELGLHRFHVLAHDYGDTVAQELLARQNEGKGAGQWQSVCFLNGGLFPETHHALLLQKLLLSPLGPLLNRFAGETSFARSFTSVFGEHTQPTAAELQEFWHLINLQNGKHIFHNLITYMRDRKQHRERWVQALQQSSVPVGLINGSVDPVSGSHMIDRFDTLECRKDYLAQLPAIGHYPQVEAPDEVATHYLRFVQQASDSGQSGVA